MSASMTRAKTPEAVVASERGDVLLETEIGTIASDWKVAQLSAICEPPQYGFTASAEDQGNVRFLRITDITDSGVKWSTIPFCECPTELLNKYILASGDIVFARIGATTGKSYLISNPPPCVFASYLIRVRAKEEIEPTFLSQYFRSVAYWRQVDAQKKTNLKMGVNGSLLKTLIVPVPPLAEQRKIAGVLGLVQRAMEQQERLIALTTELKKTLLHQLFTQGLHGEPQKQTEIGPVPESWEVIRLGDVAKLQSGGTPARDKPEYWTAGDIPWVKTGEIDYRVITRTEEKITREGLANSAAKVFPKGTLLIAMYGQGLTRGRVGLLGIDAATNQACAAITPQNERRVSTLFIYHFLEFHYEDLRQMGHGANQRNLNVALIKGFRISLPTPDEQARIVEALGVLDTKLTLHQSTHSALTALFRTLLHHLMTAQLRVHDLDLPELENTQ